MSSSGGFAWTRLGVLLLAAAALPSCGGSGSSAPAALSGGGSKASISQDGRFIAFETGSPGSDSQLVVVDRVNATSSVINATNVSNAAMSPDGLFVAFDAVPSGGGPRQVFLKDQTTGTVTLVSATAAGAAGDGDSSNPSVSDGGAFVAFESKAVNLGARSSSSRSVLVRDVRTTTIRSASSPATGDDVSPAISGNGGFVAFESQPLAGSGFSTVELWSQQSGQLTTVTQTPSGAPPDGPSGSPSINLDGRFVAFESRATNLVGKASPPVVFAGESNIFVRDVLTSLIVTASVPLKPGTPANGDSHHPSLSEDGTQVAFDSTATNLTADMVVPGMSNVFLRNLSTGATTLVTTPSGQPTTPGAAVTPSAPAAGAGTAAGGTAGGGNSVGVLSTGTPVTTTGSTSPSGPTTPVVTPRAPAPTTAATSPVLSTSTPVTTAGSNSPFGPTTPVVGSRAPLPTTAATSPVLSTSTPVTTAGSTSPFGPTTPVVTPTPPVPTTAATSPVLSTSMPVTTAGSTSPSGATTPVVGSMTPTSMRAALPVGSVRPALSPEGAWVVFESRGQDLAGASDASGTHIFVADLRSGEISEINLGSK
jgi:hypothetical protein